MTEALGQYGRVVLGICTYKRPDKLSTLLSLLEPQISDCELWQVRIVVVDNDSSMSARATVERHAYHFSPGQLEYINEPAPGVGNARNAVFRSVQDGEILVLFDDDQEPASNWLSEILSRHRNAPDEVLVGPVVPQLPEAAPAWVVDAQAWGRRNLPDGTTQKHAGFGNILIPETVLKSGLCSVPEDFLCGPGEDTLITSRFTAAGYVIRHVASAKAIERVTQERMTIEWLRRRAEISGETWIRVVRTTGGSEAHLVLSMLKIAASLIVARFVHGFTNSPTSKVQFEVARGRLKGYRRMLFSKRSG